MCTHYSRYTPVPLTLCHPQRGARVKSPHVHQLARHRMSLRFRGTLSKLHPVRMSFQQSIQSHRRFGCFLSSALHRCIIASGPPSLHVKACYMSKIISAIKHHHRKPLLLSRGYGEADRKRWDFHPSLRASKAASRVACTTWWRKPGRDWFNALFGKKLGAQRADGNHMFFDAWRVPILALCFVCIYMVLTYIIAR